MSARRCTLVAFGRHSARWTDDGKRIVHRDGNPLKATCLHCGRPIERSTTRSPWWYLDSASVGLSPTTTPRSSPQDHTTNQ